VNNSLGIFFGPKAISLAETRGKELLHAVQIDRSSLVNAGLDEKVPEEIKLIALFKDEIRKNKIEAKEAGLALSGNDLIVRTFEMPLLNPSELKRAINFEVKKYIPFKLEDLVADSQIRTDKIGRKNLVLFVGIKKDVLNKYLTVLKQLDITLVSIEYSPFSVLRFAKMAGAGSWGTSAIVSAGFKEDEANFMILENGFPLFSRDISTAEIINTQGAETDAGRAAFLDKLKTELRFSFDFYRRKFPTKKIKKVFFLVNPDYHHDLEPFMKEIGLSPSFIDVSKYVGKPTPFSLGFIRSYSCSLFRAVNTSIRIDLLAVKKLMDRPKELNFAGEVAALVTEVRLDPRAVVLALLILGGTYGYTYYRQLPLKKDIEKSIAKRPQVVTVSAASPYEELLAVSRRYQEKLAVLDKFVRKQLYFTELLDLLPAVMPEGTWLLKLNFNQQDNKAQLELQCIAFSTDNDKGMRLANDFFMNLKKNNSFMKFFKDANITSMKQNLDRGLVITRFSISCRGA
jgi:hypothetical protein